jgi:hypothetical protein
VQGLRGAPPGVIWDKTCAHQAARKRGLCNRMSRNFSEVLRAHSATSRNQVIRISPFLILCCEHVTDGEIRRLLGGGNRTKVAR